MKKSMFYRVLKRFKDLCFKDSKKVVKPSKSYGTLEEALSLPFEFPDGTKWYAHIVNGVKSGDDFVKKEGRWEVVS
jgi:hypothetical protein